MREGQPPRRQGHDPLPKTSREAFQTSSLLLGRRIRAFGRFALSVRDWPTYLLRDIPEATRTALEEDAALNERSMAEVMREILCSHYDLDCEAVEALGRPPEPTKGTDTMILRVQPALFAAIKADAGSADTHYGSPRGAMRHIILDILAAHYNGGHPQ